MSEKARIAEEIIENKIYVLRGKKVMLDRDLALLYGVETKYLIRQVKRNLKRFPEDFAYRLTRQEVRNLRCHFVTSSHGGIRYLSYVFTEQGIAMLSSVLNSPRAIEVNIQIMRTFIKLRQMFASNEELRRKVEAMEKKYDQQFQVVFNAIKKLLDYPAKPKRQIGFLLD